VKAAETIQQARYLLRSPAARVGMAVNGVLFIALLAVLLAYWWPSARTQQALERQIDAARRAVSLAMQAKDLIKAYAGAARATEAVERKLNAPVKQAQLVQGLAGVAGRHGVRIISESYEEGKPQGDYVPLFMQVALQGGYQGMRGFLGDVSTLPLWVEIEEARLERLREPAGQVKVQTRLRAVRRAVAAVAAGS
jgi:Tfp pilus assembly protein PilO